ncbi:MAG TPA: glycerate kinase [Tepidisphaeraceae bacterium]|jgi:glycerate kinase
MRVVIAPDKFKDCLTASEVADAIAGGVRNVDPLIEIELCPMADGGEGTVEALVAATGGKIVIRHVTGPLPRMKVDAPIGILGDGVTAVIEMSSASGLYLLKGDQRDPTRTTTYGTGELLREAQRLGATKIIVGIGGSATVDGGIGAAQAWGATFTLSSGSVYRENGRRLTGGDLMRLRSIESSLPLETLGIEFTVACDVGNPLLGPDGAAAIFGPQKGATPEQVDQLESGLSRLVEKTGRHDLADKPGAGAAGGLGFGMMAFFNATLRPGIQIMIDALRLRERLKGADLCITGEGKLDSQSLAGKTSIGVAQLCKEMNIPCIALAGAVDSAIETMAKEQGLTASFAIARGPTTLEDSLTHAAELLKRTAEQAFRCVAAR